MLARLGFLLRSVFWVWLEETPYVPWPSSGLTWWHWQSFLPPQVTLWPLVRRECILMTPWFWWGENVSSWPCGLGEVRTGPPITAKVLNLCCWQLVITIGGSTENRDGEETTDCGRRADSSSTRSWCWGWTRCTLRVPWGSWGSWGLWTQPLLPPCRKVCAWTHTPVCLTQ